MFVSFQVFTAPVIERNVMIRRCTRLGTTITEQNGRKTEGLLKDGQTLCEMDRGAGHFRLFFGFQWTVYLLFFLHDSITSCSGRLSIFRYRPCALGLRIRPLKIVIANYSYLALFPIRLQRILLSKIPTVTFTYHLTGMNEFSRYSYGTAAHLSRT